MPTISFTLTVKQAQRVQEASAYYNERMGAALTAKQFIWLLAREGIRAWLARKEAEATSATSNTAAALVEADLEGEV